MASTLSPPRVLAIVGPTASGKSELAMEAALRFSGEIVSCDSVQVYRGLEIGSGQPSAADRAHVPHHLVGILDLDEEMNAAVFAQRAARAIGDISARGRLPILTGGTGLYLMALLKGVFEQGDVDPGVRGRLEALATRHGSARLHRLLEAKDPAYASRTKATDRVRIVRALEVRFALGRPFSSVQQERRPAFLGEAMILGLQVNREVLRKRVTERVQRMLSIGLIEETRRALYRVSPGSPPPRPLNAIGYREVVARLSAGPLSQSGDDELVRAIVTSTMQYAKRQMTYFRHQFDVEWFEAKSDAINRIEHWIERVTIEERGPAGENGPGLTR